MENGKYKTDAGSTVRIWGKNSGCASVAFDWLEESACCDCEPEPYPDDGLLTWSCDYCDGGSAELHEMTPNPPQLNA